MLQAVGKRELLIGERGEARVLEKHGRHLVLEPSGAVRRDRSTPSLGRVHSRGDSTVGYTVDDCSLGRVLMAGTEAGVRAVLLGDEDKVLLEHLHHELPLAGLKQCSRKSQPWKDVVLSHLNAERAASGLSLCLEGTPFQLRVWQALCEIPVGSSRSYAEVAAAIGSPRAMRAVGTACGNNLLAVLVPCHRVVRADRSPGRYRWGLERKRLLLDRERCL
jgi:AraC family transcriptional regulator, regulatory protein of adaptative response / methylated-DNA-[protein]-cysteine methyltransferase